MVKKLVSRVKFAKLAGVSRAAVTNACKAKLRPAVEGKMIDINHPAADLYLATKLQKSEQHSTPGMDPLYDQVVEFCIKNNEYSIAGVRRYLKCGFDRASAIINIMMIGGLIPDEVIKSKPGRRVKIQPPPAPPPTLKISQPELEPKKLKSKPIIRKPTVKRSASNVEMEDFISLSSTLQKRNDKIKETPKDIEEFLDFTLGELFTKFGTESGFVDWLNATQKIEAINEKRLKNAQTEGVLISRELVRVGVIDTFNSAHMRLLSDGAKTIVAGVISKHSAGLQLSEVEMYVSDILGSFIKPIKAKVARVIKNA